MTEINNLYLAYHLAKSVRKLSQAEILELEAVFLLKNYSQEQTDGIITVMLEAKDVSWGLSKLL